MFATSPLEADDTFGSKRNNNDHRVSQLDEGSNSDFRFYHTDIETINCRCGYNSYYLRILMYLVIAGLSFADVSIAIVYLARDMDFYFHIVTLINCLIKSTMFITIFLIFIKDKNTEIIEPISYSKNKLTRILLITMVINIISFVTVFCLLYLGVELQIIIYLTIGLICISLILIITIISIFTSHDEEYIFFDRSPRGRLHNESYDIRNALENCQSDQEIIVRNYQNEIIY